MYYRLSKVKWEAIKKRRIDEARQMAVDLYTRGEARYNANDLAGALQFWIQALQSLENYYHEALEAEIDGKKDFLVNKLMAEIQGILQEISLKPLSSPTAATVGKSVEGVAVQVTDLSGAPVSQIGLTVTVQRGKIDLIEKISANRMGLAIIPV
ncbi:MAG TPA: hypothetical protein ENN84_06970 [Candidatus Marinimicrobia bacterium]|nr:hypothetical protein [Candidatus Neomarinimicrobiota bacterium]